ncbi:MAG: class I SAM-dependent methyltransferase [Allosphingosinicella sp.]|uniref:class I SAM-dependent methyltransferase n=1 Tax=Allosphingosinicella sp. TaxID=2823234 RepID=UPI0039513E3F
MSTAAEHANSRVNLGCGQSPTAGWLNLDNSLTVRLARTPLAHLLPGRAAYVAHVRSHNIRYGNALATGLPSRSIDVLYTSHMLEHLDQAEARRFLAEALRVLRPGGILRIAVPDIRLQAEEYLRRGDADWFVAKTRMTTPKPKSLLGRLRYAFTGFRHHHWMYDAKSLCTLLAEAGFQEPRALPAGETTIPHPGDLNLREREHESLYAEGRA